MCSMGYHPAKGKDGMKHMEGSLHYEGLAEDVDLYDKDWNYISTTEGHAIFGAYWKSLNPNHAWGGDFKKKDGNHYSFAWNGKK